ncbi:kinase-like domain-containing protein [Aspergillus carlsbadensis]|nr:kinase-like domain-containing protein [Aspergillus carlsbadensis]
MVCSLDHGIDYRTDVHTHLSSATSRFSYAAQNSRRFFCAPDTSHGSVVVSHQFTTKKVHNHITLWANNEKDSEESRTFPTTGFSFIDSERCFEEEEIPDYQANRFYPVELGQIVQDRYQIIAKFGFGSSSTTWLARDLQAHRYVALKIYVHTSLVHRELPLYHHIAGHVGDSSHPGRRNIRSLLDSFEIKGPDGNHLVLVFDPAQMSLRDMKVVFFPDGFHEDFVRGAVIELLKGLDFLHTQAEIVHTDVHPGNMLLGAYDNQIFKTLEEKEFTSPVPRKNVSGTRTIYLSRAMRPREGPMLLSDFGEARIGPGPHGGDIMPLEYRAPETLLYVCWSYPVDIWSVDLTVRSKPRRFRSLR